MAPPRADRPFAYFCHYAWTFCCDLYLYFPWRYLSGNRLGPTARHARHDGTMAHQLAVYGTRQFIINLIRQAGTLHDDDNPGNRMGTHNRRQDPPRAMRPRTAPGTVTQLMNRVLKFGNAPRQG
jgi:hypothetical protein